jgi:hypothetical protein
MSMKRSFYEMLEVPRKATREQIDIAYAIMTQKLGATTNVRGTAESLSQLNIIREGYSILSDPERRAMYDAKLYATEAGITLMFFPKDTKAVRKLGVDTVIFAALACAFTYVVYQKMTREANPVRVEQVNAEKAVAAAPKAEAPGKASTAAEPAKTAPTTGQTAAPVEANAIARVGDK